MFKRYPYTIGLLTVISFVVCIVWLFTHEACMHPLGTVIDDEDDEEEDDGPDDAGELDELEHMRDVADMAYAALSDLALHCHNRREDVAWGIASSAAKDAHVLATFVGDWIEDMEDED